MNSLMNYGSDDDCDDSSGDKQTDRRRDNNGPAPPKKDTKDVNYEEVQMDLSEGSSNDSGKDNHKKSSSSSSSSSRRRSSRDDRHKRSDHHHHRPYHHRDERRKHSRHDERRRERSRSRDRTRKASFATKRYERAMAASRPRNDPAPTVNESKIDQKSSTAAVPAANADESTFFLPEISGRFREQIERRKQLWQKKTAALPAVEERKIATKTTAEAAGGSNKVWASTTFAQDSDGKMASKFKRLMGMKGANLKGADGATAPPNNGSDELKKQEAMFETMEQQYEVARTATHTMRGVGLGFGSYQR